MVAYTWNKIDEGVAKGTDHDTPFVTPYRIWPKDVPSASSIAAGSVVEVPVERSVGDPDYVNKTFQVAGCSWEPIPDDLRNCKDLAELCAKLYAKNPLKYDLYRPERLNSNSKADADHYRGPPTEPQRMFEYWENSKYRAAVIEAGFQFGQDLRQVHPGDHPWKVLVYPPGKSRIFTSPSDKPTNVTTPPDAEAQLAVRLTTIGALTAQLEDAMKMSEEVAKARISLACQLAKLYVLLECSAESGQAPKVDLPNAPPPDLSSASVAPRDVWSARGAAAAKALMPYVKSKTKAPLSELRNPKLPRPNPDGRVEKAFRALDVYPSDLAEQADVRAGDLKELLFRDADTRNLLSTVLKGYARRGELHGAACRAMTMNALSTFAAAVGALADYGGKPEEGAQWFRIREQMPEDAATKEDEFEGDSALEVVLKTIGKKGLLFKESIGEPVKIANELVVNLTKGAALRALSEAASEGVDGVANLEARLFDSFGEFPECAEVGAKLRKAVKELYEAEPEERADLAEEVENLEKEMQAKIGESEGVIGSLGVLFKVVNLCAAIGRASEMQEDPKKSAAEKAVATVAVLQTGGEVAIGSLEGLLKLLKQLTPEMEGEFKALSKGLGVVGGIIAIVQGFFEAYEACEDGRPLHFAAGTLNMLAGGCVIAAVLVASGGPYFMIAAVTLMLGAAILEQMEESDEDRLSEQNLVAKAVLDSMERNVLFDVLFGNASVCDDPAAWEALHELREVIEHGVLTPVDRTTRFIESLRRVGLTEENIGKLTGAGSIPTDGLDPRILASAPIDAYVEPPRD